MTVNYITVQEQSDIMTDLVLLHHVLPRRTHNDKFRELLNPVAQLLNPVAHANTCISTTTQLELVIRVGRIIVGVPLRAVPLGTKCDPEGMS
jgi:hypothetical protein